MATTQAPIAPRIRHEVLSEGAVELSHGGLHSQIRLAGDFAGLEAEDLAFERCHLTVSLTGGRLPRLNLTDVTVEGSELSGVDLEGCVLTRVRFRNCRMSGLLLPHGRLRDVVFEDCRLDGANLRMVRATRIDFIRADLTDGDLYAAELESARFFDCGLAGTQFSQAVVPGARFHGSRLEGVKGAEYLRDVVIDSGQVLALALPVFGSLGIRVDDEREPGAG